MTGYQMLTNVSLNFSLKIYGLQSVYCRGTDISLALHLFFLTFWFAECVLSSSYSLIGSLIQIAIIGIWFLNVAECFISLALHLFFWTFWFAECVLSRHCMTFRWHSICFLDFYLLSSMPFVFRSLSLISCLGICPLLEFTNCYFLSSFSCK